MAAAMATIMLSRLLRSFFLITLLTLCVGGVRIIHRNDSQQIALRPLLLDPDHPGLNKVGGLRFLKAWELNSDNSDFGGISALMALPDGRFVGLSDAGTLIGFGVTQDNKVDHPFIAPLPGTIGPKINYRDKDSESIAFDPGTGRFWIGFEAKHRIARFTASFARSDGKYTAPEMRLWGDNTGAEAIVRLPDGRFVVFSEGMDMPGYAYQALTFSGDPVEPGTSHFAFAYRPPAGYKPTDAAMAPDGRLLILNRRLAFPSGLSAKLTSIDPAGIKKGVTLTGKLIATLASPLLVDNMEGLAVTVEQGHTVIWMISDNNFNAWQRTILMKFILTEDVTRGAGAKKPEAETAPGFDSL
jgi:hypothetical protein